MRPVHPVTHSGTAGQDTNERLVAACPSWCDRDEKVDEGTPEEFVIHCGAESYVGSIRLQLRQVTFVDGAFEPPVLLLGEDELPMADAAHLAPVLAATAPRRRVPGTPRPCPTPDRRSTTLRCCTNAASQAEPPRFSGRGPGRDRNQGIPGIGA